MGVTPRLEIGADVAYQTLDEWIASSIVNTIFGEQAELTTWRLGARGRYALNDPSSRWLPHLIGGMALHPSKIDLRESDGSHQEFTHTGIGLSGGAGLDYRLGARWGLGLESVYYWVKSDKNEMQQSTMPYLDFNLGLRWRLGGE
jgi:opacity protein-like surface antigen